MASEAVNPVNGTYGAPSTNSSQSASLANGGSDKVASPPKDEVGWYFVEQYYTTMSRNPEKVHLYYNKPSQFVYGVEAEKVPVSVGQRAISERISELGIEDCKVRVTNVDSQESGKSIVLQVVGEMSVKSQPHRKFVQTFVLAEQPNGYYVLNDIFRYIADDPDEDEPEPAAEETAPEPVAPAVPTNIKTLSSSDNLAEQAKTAEIVDKKLEQVTSTSTKEVAAVPQIPAVVTEPVAAVTESHDAIETTEDIKPELPKDPEPSPAPSPAPPAPAVKEAPAPAPVEPAAPRTWASLVGAGKAPVPAVPAQQPAQTQTQNKASAKATAAAPAAAPAASAESITAAPSAAAPTLDNGDVPQSPGGWQTAGHDHSKKQNKAQPAGNVNGYIKNVTANIEASALKQALVQHGEVTYFDISRQKNAAFVEFKTPAGFNAAVAANPHKVNGEDIYLEERLPRPANYKNNNFRGGARGNRNSIDGRAGGQAGRGGFKDNRGGFVTRGRGGAAATRGRGAAGQEA